MASHQSPQPNSYNELRDEELANLTKDAVNAGDEKEFINIILHVRNINVKSTDDSDRTLLAIAARHGMTEAVKLILERPGVDVNVKDRGKKTALQLAIWQGHEEIAMRLLKRPEIDPHHGIDGLLNDGLNHNLDDAVLHLLSIDPRMFRLYPVQQAEVISKALSKDLVLAKTLISKSSFVAHNDGYSPQLLLRILRCKSGNLRKWSEFPASPVQKHLDDQYGDLVEALLKRPVNIRQIEASAWLSAYRRETTDTVQITHSKSGVKEVSFLNQQELECRIRLHEKECEGEVASNSPSRQSFFLLSRKHSEILNGPLINFRREDGPNPADHNTFLHTRIHGFHIGFTIAAKAPVIEENGDGVWWRTHAIGWLSIVDPNTGLHGRPVDCYSTLSATQGVIYNVERLILLVGEVEKGWLSMITQTDKNLSRFMSVQMLDRNRGSKNFDYLATRVQHWNKLRNILEDQTTHMLHLVQVLQNYEEESFDDRQALEDIQKFRALVNAQLDRLDERVQYLLQLEYTRASINDASSIKRLSYITFIFLPLMFSSSLFGMNVNLLEENPDWRWYILVAFVCSILVLVPLFFKYLTLQSYLELSLKFPWGRSAHVRPEMGPSHSEDDSSAQSSKSRKKQDLCSSV